MSKIEGNYDVAIVNLLYDDTKRDYRFALYDIVKKGDYVVVNLNNHFALGIIRKVLSKDSKFLYSKYRGKNVTREVVSVVNMENYYNRVKDRNSKANLEKEKRELRKQLDSKIAKLRDVEFYQKMATEFSEKDPEIAKLVNKLKELEELK